MTYQNTDDQEPRTIYCMHCGTAATEGDYACNRCGERVYIPDPSRVPPLGFTSCAKCATVNEAHASYCAACAAEIGQSARISPDGAQANRNERRSPFGSENDTDEESEIRGGRYRIGGGTFNPSQWGLPRRNRPTEEEDGDTPREIQRWNLGAFLLGPIWGIIHGQWWTLIGFLPFLPLSPTLRAIGFIVLLGVMIILGLRGNEMAWRSRQWESTEKFLAVQQSWTTRSILFAIGIFVAIILYLFWQG